MKALQLLLLFSFLTCRMLAFIPLSSRRDSPFYHRNPPLATHSTSAPLTGTSSNEGDNDTHQQVRDNGGILPTRPTQRRKRAGRSLWFRALAAIAVFLRSITGTPPLAQAKFSYELSESPTYSLRPGMSSEQAQMLLKGEASIDQVVPTTPDDSSQPATSANKAKESLYGDYTDEEDDDFADALEPTAPVVDRRLMGGKKTTVPEAPKARSQQFAARDQGKSPVLYAKVAAGLFVPTFGGMFLREYIRRQREEEYVKKGLAILAAQKAEYFNLTSSEGDDEGLNKKNGTNSDQDDDKNDDDEDDDDDDDDDDDGGEDDTSPSSSTRGRPKRPRGGGGGDGSDDKNKGGNGNQGGSGSNDYGYGRPSDEDLDKLNQLFRKS